jgi:hypothetical protein
MVNAVHYLQDSFGNPSSYQHLFLPHLDDSNIDMCCDSQIQDGLTSEEKLLSDEKAKVFKTTSCCLMSIGYQLTVS